MGQEVVVFVITCTSFGTVPFDIIPSSYVLVLDLFRSASSEHAVARGHRRLPFFSSPVCTYLHAFISYRAEGLFSILTARRFSSISGNLRSLVSCFQRPMTVSL